MKPTFVHLRTHTEFSLANSVVRIPNLIEKVAELNMPAVAITDQSNIFAAVKFFKKAVHSGVKPIIGADVWIANPDSPKAPFKLILLAQNDIGFNNLCGLITRAYRDGQYQDLACIHREWLVDNNNGLIALSGGLEGEIGQSIECGHLDQAATITEQYQSMFDQRFYIELQRTGHRHQEEYNQQALELVNRHSLPVVATNDVQFISPDDFESHEVRVCIHDGRVLNDKRRPRKYNVQQYLRTPSEMQQLFSDIPQAIENTIEIAIRCNYQLQVGDYFLPNFPIPKDQQIDNYLDKQAQQGLRDRLSIINSNGNCEVDIELYQDRLKRELGVISQMGFPGYFLIVADFISWSKQAGIPVGPGRGSGAGSLVAYALGITELDPIEHGLLFERFLNPERVSLPDFDIDFCMEGRDRVIEYVANQYGRNQVAQIITYGTMAARAVVRDVGRVLGMSYGFIDVLAKMIPFEIGMTLDKALEQEPELLERYNNDDDIRELIDMARSLEGLARNVGKHAGGVVIAPNNLTSYTALYCEQGSNQSVTQYDKDDLETVGLVKFDFLGLRTLTIIDWAIKSINQERQQQNKEPLNIALIDMKDEKTYQLLQDCHTTALFQLESRGMRDLVKSMQPSKFEDLVALLALFRPGPLQSGMVEDYIDRKHGRAPLTYLHPELEPILKETYGVILYQEQVMEIARVLSGYTLGSADMLRRAMGKKKPEEMARQGETFKNGAINHGVDGHIAQKIFDLIEKFSGYGFNKSHSAAYALISYQTAWLKAHYTAHFMAAALSSDMDNTDKVLLLLSDCRNLKIEILPPDVNHSVYMFRPTDESHIRYGLGAIKGLGRNVIDEIINARETGGDFKDLFDFCRRVVQKKLNKRACEALIRSGALDQLGAHRASMLATLPKAMKLAGQASSDESAGQDDLFGLEQSQSQDVLVYEKIKAWPQDILLKAEKEALGLYFSGHPLDPYRKELDQFTVGQLADLKPTSDRMVVVAGNIVAIRTMKTRRGGRMAFVTLDDETSRMELAVFSDSYQENKDLIQKDQLLVVNGKVSVDEYSGGFKMSAEDVYSISQARSIYANQLVLRFDEQTLQRIGIEKIENQLNRAQKGHSEVVFHYRANGVDVVLPAGKSWRIKISDEIVESFEALLGTDAVDVRYGAAAESGLDQSLAGAVA